MSTVTQRHLSKVLGLESPRRWRRVLGPWLWISPAVLFVGIFLLYPVTNTLLLSFQNADSTRSVGMANYRLILTDRTLLLVLHNNVIWIVVGTAATVLLGLVIATLVDRVRIEGAAKAAIFIPMAISFVGAGVIWRFIYQYEPPDQPQIGMLNALFTRFGGQPQAWLINPAINNFALITVYVWIWTGFCMVILSAALKGVPPEIIESARVDGAGELAIFCRLIVPIIRPTIMVVATTMVINLLKIFDIVYVMTGGNYNTDVVAYEYYRQTFTFNDFGVSSALAVLLLLAVIPVMVFNVRQFRQREVHR